MLGPRYRLDVLEWMQQDREGQAPPLEEVRPARCSHCAAAARAPDGRVVLEGNGVRLRQVVVVDFGEVVQFRRTRCWSRRYRCNRCGGSTLVLPGGVLPGCLYSVAAVVVAWFGASVLGRAHSTTPLDLRQSPRSSRDEGSVRRWRSLERWAARIEEHWPWYVTMAQTWPQRVEGLLWTLSFRARSLCPRALAVWATASHTAGGVAM